MLTDVEVIVTRETQPLTQAGFGMPLILATNTTKDYAEYTNISDVAVDYPETTEAYKIAARVLGQSPRPPKIAMIGVIYDDDPTTLTSKLNDLVQTNNDWYFLLCEEQHEDEINALSSWVDTQKKLYFVTTDDMALPADLESDNTVIMYHDDPTQYVAEGWVGRCAPELPGSITWKFKTVNGVAAADIKTGELAQLHEDGGNSYVRKLGILQSSEGLTTSGEYIDVIRSQHFIEARLVEQVTSLFVKSGKVPFDNSGIALIVAESESVMKQATAQGIIALDDDGNGLWTVTAPSREEIPAGNVANRVLDGVVIEAVLAGAIHGATIRVTLRY